VAIFQTSAAAAGEPGDSTRIAMLPPASGGKLAMLDPEAKASIDGMSKADLWAEMVKGPRSRFQGDRRDYLMARFHLLDQAEQDEKARRGSALVEEVHKIAKASKGAAEEAGRTAQRSSTRAGIALIVSALALLVAIAAIVLPHH
jgi:hypothetical protein